MKSWLHPWCQMTAGGAEKSQQCRMYFLQYFSIFFIYFRKTSGSKMGASNLFLAQGAI